MADRLSDKLINVYLLPPSLLELENRLRGWNQDSDETVATRPVAARDEIAGCTDYDNVVRNLDLKATLASLETILCQELLVAAKNHFLTAINTGGKAVDADPTARHPGIMPRIPEKCRLLHGPYHAPPLSRGDQATCLLRDGDVVITGWTAARIPWPRCQAVGVKGGSGVLLDEELARAVRTEAAAAVGYWWGVTEGVVWRWRKALGVTKTNNPRTYQLQMANAQAGADALKAKEWTEQEIEVKRRI